jgi:glycosyltransferase involved in cell wall biosynthesis
VLELLPELARIIPTLSYLLVGDGDDRIRLEEKAAALGVRERVVFAGYIPEAEKAAHYRIADAFVMAGRGEGFGIVYLEALACGVPVVASTADASREAVLNGTMGEIADPDKPDELKAAILRVLDRPVGIVPKALENFSVEKFRERWGRLVDEVFRSDIARDKSSDFEFTKDSTVRPVGDPPKRRLARMSVRSRN